MISASEPKL